MDSKIAALGLDTDTAAKVENVFKEILKDNYIPIARFNEVNEAKKKLEDTVKERDVQIAELGKADDVSDKLKKQIESLQAKNVADKEQYEASLKQMRTDKYIDDVLMENGVLDAKFLPAIKAYLPDVDIDSEDSKKLFSVKLAEVKSASLPMMFKSDKNPDAEVKGFHPALPDNSASSGTGKDDGSYAYYLKSHGINVE